ncbi:MAG TPA: phage holin family protein [Gemmataceae bacterium]|jgi:hypothetical protein
MDTTGAANDTLTALGRGILADVEQLLGQHYDLLRQEIKDELAKAAGAGLAVTTGAGATAVGGLLGVLAAVHLLHKATGLPLWLCYALTGGVLAGAGGGLIAAGAKQAAGIDLVPRQTIEAVREDVTAVRHMAAPV